MILTRATAHFAFRRNAGINEFTILLPLVAIASFSTTKRHRSNSNSCHKFGFSCISMKNVNEKFPDDAQFPYALFTRFVVKLDCTELHINRFALYFLEVPLQYHLLGHRRNCFLFRCCSYSAQLYLFAVVLIYAMHNASFHDFLPTSPVTSPGFFWRFDFADRKDMLRDRNYVISMPRWS